MRSHSMKFLEENGMDDISAELAALLDRERIRRCLVALARGEDRRDADMICAACWPDSITDYGVFRGDFTEYLSWVVPGSPALPCTQHFLGQSHIELDGQRARVETQVMSYHRVDTGDEHRDTMIAGRYLDVLEKRDGGWRIAQRTMLYDWVQDFGTAIDWSQGVMGMPFSSEHFSGRAKGDYSVKFFAGHLS